jgi:Raf kinase inhibitor-like YbhB/YbcL family protein
LKIVSPAFEYGCAIPSQYTADGLNISPPFEISEVPISARTLAIICDDPDAPTGGWVHWVIFNLPADINVIPEDCKTYEILPFDGIQGTNDFGRIGYSGPAPPSGTHRYYFTLYALDIRLDLPPGILQQQLENAMKDHTLTQTTFMGKYSFVGKK